VGAGGRPTPAPAPAKALKDPDSAVEPLDPQAPDTYRPVVRDGSRPSPSLKANNGRFAATGPVRFADGVSLTVDRVRHGTEQEQGPGAFPGRRTTSFSLSLHNRSTRAVEMNHVVVTTSYRPTDKARARLAPPVYADLTAGDFSGTVQPGASTSATYVFAIPARQAAHVVLRVDFDDVHVAATFTGATS